MEEMDSEKYLSAGKSGSIQCTLERCKVLSQKYGVYSSIAMNSAGFYYTGIGDTVHCDKCDLKVSGWTQEMDPFKIHAQRSPTCSFVLSILPKEIITMPSKVNILSSISLFDADESPSKYQKTKGTQEISQANILNEVELTKQIRKRTFSHWSHRTSPSSAQMVEAGFFNCNVGDRVICIYCNLICEHWALHTDDPWEIHKTLSPKCPFVIAAIKRQETASIRIVNELSSRDNSTTTASNDLFRSDENVPCFILDYANALGTSTIPQLVENRLYLPVSKRLVDQGFSLSIIKRCYEDQLQLKQDDFVSDSDLLVACMICQKQNEYADRSPENIIIPSVAMKKIHERQQRENVACETLLTNPSSNSMVQIPTSFQYSSMNDQVQRTDNRHRSFVESA